jgi:hypothetical protein
MTDSTNAPPVNGLEHRQILVVFTGLMAGMLLAALDQTIVSTALPTIAGTSVTRSDWPGSSPPTC